MANSLNNAPIVIDRRMTDAARGNCDALFDLGICYSTGTAGVAIDLIEAHKWFNLAAVAGLGEAADARTEIAGNMTARQIAEAQRQARAWIGSTQRRAA